MKTMKLTITEISVHPSTESPIFGEQVTRIRLDNEGAGYFVRIVQDGEPFVWLDFDELEYVIQAVNMLKKGISE